MQLPAHKLASLNGGFSTPEYSNLRVRRRVLTGAFLVLVSLALGASLILYRQQPAFFWFLALPLALLPVLWVRPVIGVYLLVAGAVLFESFSLNFPDSFTDHIPFFKSFTSMDSPTVIPVTPAELLMVMTACTYTINRMLARQKLFEPGPLFWAIGLYSLIVAAGLVHGIVTGGGIVTALWEVRNQFYLILLYVLALNLVHDRGQIKLVMWIFLGAAAFKGLLGSWRYLVTLGGDLSQIDVVSTTNSLMAHEESYFLGLFLIFIFIMFLVRGDRDQLRFALIFSAPVLLAFLANQRRVGVLALVIGLAVAALLVFLLVRHRRKLVTGLVVLAAALVPPYLIFLGTEDSLLAEPASAVTSVAVQPGTRDFSSNQYRITETENLKMNIAEAPWFGAGYGQPITMFLPLTDLSELFWLWDTIPHNTVLWVWLRIGLIGFAAFWFMAGRVMVEAAMTARAQGDTYLRGIAIFSLAALLGWITFGVIDMGLIDFRSSIFLGVLFGLVARISALRCPEAARQPGQT